MNSYLLTGSVYFNKDMINDYSLESPYKLVHEGEWTWDAMFTMAETAAEDLNGDEEYTNEDRYGITYINDSPEVLLAAPCPRGNHCSGSNKSVNSARSPSPIVFWPLLLYKA